MAVRGLDSNASRSGEANSRRIRLDWTESPIDVPAAMKKEILRRLDEIEWLCLSPAALKDLLARTAACAGWIEEGVLIGNGSAELLQLMFLSFRERGRGFVISQPTDMPYASLARNLAIDVHEVRMLPDFAFDVAGIILAAHRTRASLIVLSSPNNPTGTQLPAAEVRRILESTEATLLIDETYVRFAPESMAPLLSRYERLVILQTCATAPGAAALPFAYAFCWPDLACQMREIRPPTGVNILTLVAAEVFMDHWSFFQDRVEALKSERSRMYSQLSLIPGVRAHRSEGNFLLFEVLTRGAGVVHRSLDDRGILVRDVSSLPMLERALRVTIGTAEENGGFLRALREVVR